MAAELLRVHSKIVTEYVEEDRLARMLIRALNIGRKRALEEVRTILSKKKAYDD